MIKNKTLALILFVLVVFGVWTLCDFLYARFISHNAFVFTLTGNVILPLAAGLITGYFAVFKGKDK